jgi:hypothetical protein
MKTTLMTIALAFATLPLTFAAQTPATPPASGSGAPAATTPKVKKHHKTHAVKPAVKKTSGSTTPAAKPALAVKQ